MRITNNMLINNMLRNVGNNLTRMDKYQQQMATGKKIVVPSDDPIVAARALKLRTDVAEIQQYKRNVDDATSWMEVTESTLSNVNDVLQRARELAVQASNGSNATEDTQKIAEEIGQLKGQLVHLGNTTYAGRYIFSGYETDVKLMNEDGTFNISVENTETIKYEIGIGDDININVTGGDLFNAGANSVGTTVATAGQTIGNGGITFPLTIAAPNNTLDIEVDGEAVTAAITPQVYNNISDLAAEVQTAVNGATGTATDITVAGDGNKLRFTSGSTGSSSKVVIDGASTAAAALGLTTSIQQDGVNGTTGTKGKLIQDFEDFEKALNEGNISAINEIIGELDGDINNGLRLMSDVGARMNRLELTANRLETDNLNFTKIMSENEDIDMAETIMNLKNEENVYRASLSGGARIIQPSLVDFLK